ncbi:MAG: FAD-dependent monooxygenase [Candidatus Marinamargulisbacteria bacterium]
MNALSTIGMANIVLKKGVPITHFQVQDSLGNVLLKTDFNKLSHDYGGPAVGITRANLQQILIEHLPKHGIKWGYNCNSSHTANGRTTIKAAGMPDINADIIIGADGIRSTLKKLILKVSHRRYSHQTSWRGLGPIPNTMPYFFESWGVGQRFGAVPINATQAYWYACINTPPNQSKYAKLTKKELIDRYRGWSSEISHLIQGTSQIIHTDIYNAYPVIQWHRNNVVLLGDAIHPTTPNLGQGAGMAIESSIVLANSISKAPDIYTAFQQFQFKRQQQTQWVTQQSWRFGKLAQLNHSWACRIRNMAMLMTPNRLAMWVQHRQLHQLFGYSVVNSPYTS